jgi:hypothetical protein
MMSLGKKIDRAQGLLPWLNIKEVPEGASYPKGRYKGFNRGKDKSSCQQEKVSLSFKDKKDSKSAKKEPLDTITQSSQEVQLTVDNQTKHIDITV